MSELQNGEVNTVSGYQTLLHALVAARGWPPGRFCREYDAAAQDLAAVTGYRNVQLHRATARRWFTGALKELPIEPAPRVLEHLFPGYTVKQLLGPFCAQNEGSPARGSQQPLHESELLMTARDAAAHAGDAASQVLPEMTLDQLDEDIRSLAHAYASTPPLEVHRQAKELLDLAQAAVDRTQRPSQRGRAFRAAGMCAALLSAAVFDLGSLRAATAHARTAALYGEVSEYSQLQAYAYGALGVRAYWAARPREAIRFIKQAQAYGGLGDTARIRLQAIEARAWAHLGDQESALVAMRRIDELTTGARDELHDDIGGGFGFPPGQVAMSNATTCLLMNDAAGAEEASARALTLLEADPSQQRPVLVTSQAAVDLARARLIRDELDGAAAALRPVFDVPVQWRGAGLVERLAAAQRDITRLPDPNASTARALGEEIEDFTRVAVARQLGASPGHTLEG